MPEPAKLLLEIDEPHKYTFKNKDQVQKSNMCCCACCVNKYSAKYVVEYIEEANGDKTAICPKCGVDAVIGDAALSNITDTMLQDMHNKWFR
jgi:hypothetical protein